MTAPMTLSIYSIEYRDPVPADILNTLLERLPEDIRQKAGKFRRWQDAHACILGKHLLLTALRAEGFAGNLSGLQYTAHGRPHFTTGPDFNISHSGNRVVCIIGRQGKVGIDLEEMRNMD